MTNVISSSTTHKTITAFALAMIATTVTAFADDKSKPKEPGTEKVGKVGTAVTLEIASWEETQKIIAEHKGKIVVLDFWSTWCEPCVKEFPGLVKLQAAHPGEVVCISLNCNYIGDGKPEAEREDVLAFLNKQKAVSVVNLLCSDADEDLYKKAKISSVPVTRVYGRDGKLAKQFDNSKEEYGKEGFTYEKNIIPYVKKLVEAKN